MRQWADVDPADEAAGPAGRRRSVRREVNVRRGADIERCHGCVRREKL
jgi:hypothetical protein